jgi:hypothetical protein
VAWLRVSAVCCIRERCDQTLTLTGSLLQLRRWRQNEFPAIAQVGKSPSGQWAEMFAGGTTLPKKIFQ